MNQHWKIIYYFPNFVPNVFCTASISLSFNLKRWRGHFTPQPHSPQLLSLGEGKGPRTVPDKNRKGGCRFRDRDGEVQRMQLGKEDGRTEKETRNWAEREGDDVDTTGGCCRSRRKRAIERLSFLGKFYIFYSWIGRSRRWWRKGRE